MDDFELPEKAESKKERIIGLIIAGIAVVLAIVSVMAHKTQNEEILTHGDAADQYAFYQAKKVRHEQLELSTDSLKLTMELLSPASQATARQLLEKYATEMTKLDSDSKSIKEKGDDLVAESGKLATKANVLDLGEIGLQIAVVLCGISILTEQNLFVRMGVTIASVGLLVALWGMFGLH